MIRYLIDDGSNPGVVAGGDHFNSIFSCGWSLCSVTTKFVGADGAAKKVNNENYVTTGHINEGGRFK